MALLQAGQTHVATISGFFTNAYSGQWPREKRP